MLMNALENIRIWIFLSIIVAFIIGPVGDVSTLIVVVLLLQMIGSMEGLRFERSDFSKNSKQVIYSLIATFVICSGMSLAIGSLFMGYNTELWYGWVILASAPCAVSVITSALYLKGNMKATILGLTACYFVALVFTPVITFIFLGDSISPLKIFSYVLLFVAIPLLVNIPLRRFKINRHYKIIFINATMGAMVFLSLGKNRDYMLADPTAVLLIVIACLIRIFLISLIVLYLCKRRGCSREDSEVYMVMSIWKNSALATSMCMVLLADSPEAVLPCVISLVIETIWFMVISRYFERIWPSAEISNGTQRPIEN